MLKRLLIAVFVLGLILSLNGTAFSDVYPDIDAQRRITETNTNAPLYGTQLDCRPIQPTFKKSPADFRSVPAGMTVPAPPLDYFCEDVDYSSGIATWYWTIPDAYNDDLFNMRFTSESNFDCTLKVAHFLMYGPAMVGAPDMRVYLWDDDGFGFPGTKLDSVDILNAALPTTMDWVSADFSAGNYVFGDGEEYHYGFTIIDNSGAGTDVIAVVSDNADGPHAGEERASESYAGVWGTMLNDWGADVSFMITSELCCGEIPFTDCYTQAYAGSPYWCYSTPHSSGADLTEHAMRFDVEGSDTLVASWVWIYDFGYPFFGTDDVYITVYDDDGGFPGPNVLASVTLAAGTYAAGWQYVPFGLVIDHKFHISFSTNGTPGVTWQYLVGDDSMTPNGRSSSLYNGTWMASGDVFGDDPDFFIEADICRSQFSICETKSYYGNWWFAWGIGNAYRDAASVRITGQGQMCQVKEVAWLLDDYFAEPGDFTHPIEISVNADGGGLPGAQMASIVVNPVDFVYWPTLTTVDFEPLEVYIVGDYWVTLTSLNPGTTEGIIIVSDDGTFNNGARSAGLFVGSGVWETMVDHYGDDYGWVAESEHCCEPFGTDICLPGADAGWATLQGNQGRTGRSMLGVEDAWCDLNVNWSYLDATSGVSFTGPAIYGDMAVCSFSDHYNVFDITDGSIVYTLTSTLGDGNLLGGSIRCTPTIVNMEVGGSPTDVMFIAGGASNGVGAVNFNTGALIWQRTILTGGPTGIFGQTRFCTMTVLNGIMYFTTDNGAVAAVDAETGVLSAGWTTNPVYLTGSPYISGATDGTNLFYSTQTAATEGDVYSLDAATGVINWQLSGAGGLQAFNINNGADTSLTYAYPEGFRGGVAYDRDRLYAVSYANDGGANDHPYDGIYYTIDAANGSLPIPATRTNRAQYSTPIVEINSVFAPTLTQWNNPTDPTGGTFIAFNKHTGSQIWGSSIAGGRHYTNAVLTCELDEVEETDDLIFAFNEDGFLMCYNYATGDEIFSRRIDHQAGYAGGIGMSGAIAMADGEVHMMFADYWGGLYDFTKGDDRARLEVQSYNVQVPVEFGSSTSYPVNTGPIMVNTGCADLTFTTATVDEDPITGSTRPAFSYGYITDDMMERADRIADDMKRSTFLSKFVRLNSKSIDEGSIVNVRDMDRESSYSSYSAGIPAWFLSLDHPVPGDVVAAGDTIDLEFTVDQSLVNRGPQSVYIAWESNDADYFLNYMEDAGALLPEILLTVVGGCLLDTTTLEFGVASANFQFVSNSGRLADPNWDPYGIEIDEYNSAMWMAGYWFTTSQHQLAVNMNAGSGSDEWISWQPDPNFCDDLCKPNLSTGVTIGAFSTDGFTYDPILANVICASGVDSVQNFDVNPDPVDTAWDWSAYTSPFDNDLTMGLAMNSQTYGAVDLPQLANMTLEIFEFTERNGNAVDGWKFGAWSDYDIGSANIMQIDLAYSAGWSTASSGTGETWGFVKIPFGCNETPLKNVVNLDSDASLYSGSHAYWDSCYHYASQPFGEYVSFPNATSARDQSGHLTITEHDFEADGTYKFGSAIFAFGDLANSMAPVPEIQELATLVNQLAGFGRGDVNNDGALNLADIIYLAGHINNSGPGAIPFAHIGDVDASGAVDAGDITYLLDYYFNCGPCPLGDWVL